MAYDVDFWYISQDACQISTDFTPFIEAEEESIYMKTSDFFKMVEEFTDPDLERKAKAFDTLLNYNQHVKKYNNSDCHELERVFQDVMEEYEEEK